MIYLSFSIILIVYLILFIVYKGLLEAHVI